MRELANELARCRGRAVRHDSLLESIKYIFDLKKAMFSQPNSEMLRESRGCEAPRQWHSLA